MLTGGFRPLPPPAALTAQMDDWPPQSGIGSLIAVILTLALIIVLIIVVIRFLASRSQFWSRAGAIRHLGGIGVGQQKSVQLVQVGDKVYVIGVGQDIRLLDKIEDEAEIRGIVASLAPESAFPGGKWLNALRGGSKPESRDESGRAGEAEGERARFHDVLNARIRDLGNRSGKLKERLAEEEEADGKRP